MGSTRTVRVQDARLPALQGFRGVAIRGRILSAFAIPPTGANGTLSIAVNFTLSPGDVYTFNGHADLANTSVPEPATYGMMGLGFGLMLYLGTPSKRLSTRSRRTPGLFATQRSELTIEVGTRSLYYPGCVRMNLSQHKSRLFFPLVLLAGAAWAQSGSRPRYRSLPFADHPELVRLRGRGMAVSRRSMSAWMEPV